MAWLLRATLVLDQLWILTGRASVRERQLSSPSRPSELDVLVSLQNLFCTVVQLQS